MKNLFIEYPKCTTCKKAKNWLEDNNIEFEDRNISIDNPTFQELKEWIGKSGLDIRKWRALFSYRTTARALKNG